MDVGLVVARRYHVPSIRVFEAARRQSPMVIADRKLAHSHFHWVVQRTQMENRPWTTAERIEPERGGVEVGFEWMMVRCH